jgi:hypothetical protein
MIRSTAALMKRLADFPSSGQTQKRPRSGELSLAFEDTLRNIAALFPRWRYNHLADARSGRYRKSSVWHSQPPTSKPTSKRLRLG